LKVNDENEGSGSASRSGFTPKSHGSATLLRTTCILAGHVKFEGLTSAHGRLEAAAFIKAFSKSVM
jgi:hypothetical protein